MSNQGGVTVVPWVPHISPRLTLLNSRLRSQPNGRWEGFEIRRWDGLGRSSNKDSRRAVGSINIAIVSFGSLSVGPLAQGGASPLTDHRVLLRLGTSHSSHCRFVLLCLTVDLSWIREGSEEEEESMGSSTQQKEEE